MPYTSPQAQVHLHVEIALWACGCSSLELLKTELVRLSVHSIQLSAFAHKVEGGRDSNLVKVEGKHRSWVSGAQLLEAKDEESTQADCFPKTTS